MYTLYGHLTYDIQGNIVGSGKWKVRNDVAICLWEYKGSMKLPMYVYV